MRCKTLLNNLTKKIETFQMQHVSQNFNPTPS